MQSNMGESKVVGPVQRRAISIFGSRFYYVVRPGPENAGYPPNQAAYKAGNHGQPCIGRWWYRKHSQSDPLIWGCQRLFGHIGKQLILTMGGGSWGVTMSHMSTLVTIHCWLRVDEHVKINRNFFPWLRSRETPSILIAVHQSDNMHLVNNVEEPRTRQRCIS